MFLDDDVFNIDLGPLMTGMAVAGVLVGLYGLAWCAFAPTFGF